MKAGDLVIQKGDKKPGVLVDIIEVGIIIAKDVPTDKCILVTKSKSRTEKA